MNSKTIVSGIKALIDAGPEAIGLAVALPEDVDTTEGFLKWAREEAGVDAHLVQFIEADTIWTHKQDGIKVLVRGVHDGKVHFREAGSPRLEIASREDFLSTYQLYDE